MRRRASLTACAVIALAATTAFAQMLPSAAPEQVGFSADRLDRIGRILRSEIEKRKLPGAVALVARKGRVAYFESFGLRDPATGTPMSNDTIFRVYSMTKPLVGLKVSPAAREAAGQRSEGGSRLRQGHLLTRPRGAGDDAPGSAPAYLGPRVW